MWDWLEKPKTPSGWGFALRVLVKAGVLFVALNVLFAALVPLPALGRITLYNSNLIPGVSRLPYTTEQCPGMPEINLMNLDTILASHEIAVPPADDEYRVVLIGDSATWGWELDAADTLSSYLNAGGYTLDDGRKVRVYNLAYPHPGLLRDLLLLDEAMRYTPDMVVWLFTLYAFKREIQSSNTFVMQNLESARRIVEQYNLDLTLHGDDGIAPGLWQRTIVAQRCNLVDWLRFQLNGPFWAAAGVDQSAAPDVYRTPWTAFDDNVEFLNGSPRPLTEAELTFDILRAGAAHVGETPILLVNEPIFITDGPNRHLRYSVHDPRWAYDDYRTQLVEMAEARGWDLLDAWDAIPRTEFTNAHVHLTPHGTQLFSESVGPAIVALEIEERLAVETSVCK